MPSEVPITIEANNESREYGLGNPALDATYIGLRNGDTLSAVSGLSLDTSATVMIKSWSPEALIPVTAR